MKYVIHAALALMTSVATSALAAEPIKIGSHHNTDHPRCRDWP